MFETTAQILLSQGCVKYSMISEKYNPYKIQRMVLPEKFPVSSLLGFEVNLI